MGGHLYVVLGTSMRLLTRGAEAKTCLTSSFDQLSGYVESVLLAFGGTS
jgi:hypothetical protein